MSCGYHVSQPTPTPRRRQQSRNLELERYVHINNKIPITIAPGAEKPISPHAVRFSTTPLACVRNTFLVHYVKWNDVGREYIEVVKGKFKIALVFILRHTPRYIKKTNICDFFSFVALFRA